MGTKEVLSLLQDSRPEPQKPMKLLELDSHDLETRGDEEPWKIPVSYSELHFVNLVSCN